MFVVWWTKKCEIIDNQPQCPTVWMKKITFCLLFLCALRARAMWQLRWKTITVADKIAAIRHNFYFTHIPSLVCCFHTIATTGEEHIFKITLFWLSENDRFAWYVICAPYLNYLNDVCERVIFFFLTTKILTNDLKIEIWERKKTKDRITEPEEVTFAWPPVAL